MLMVQETDPLACACALPLGLPRELAASIACWLDITSYLRWRAVCSSLQRRFPPNPALSFPHFKEAVKIYRNFFKACMTGKSAEGHQRFFKRALETQSGLPFHIDSSHLDPTYLKEISEFCKDMHGSLSMKVPPWFKGNFLLIQDAIGGDFTVDGLKFLQRRSKDTSSSSTCWSVHDNFLLRIASLSGNFPVLDFLLSTSLLDPKSKITPTSLENEAVRMAARNGHLPILLRLLQDQRTNPSTCSNEAIRVASEMGHVLVVAHLLTLPRCNPSVRENEALRLASAKGRLGVVEILLADSRVNPSACHGEALQKACENGHSLVVRTLLLHRHTFLPNCDASTKNNLAIKLAVMNDHVECVRVLMECGGEGMDPSSGRNQCIIEASSRGNVEMIEVLLRHPKVDPMARDGEALKVAKARGHLAALALLEESVTVASRTGNLTNK